MQCLLQHAGQKVGNLQLLVAEMLYHHPPGAA